MQEAVGLQSATDGELRRGSWHMDFIYQLGGVEKLDSDLVVEFKNRSGTISFTPASMRVDEPVRLDHTIFADDFTFLRDTVSTRAAEADDPVAEHGALPRRPGRDRRDRLSRPGRVLGRSHRGLSRGGRRGSANSAAGTCSSTTPASPT